MAPDRGDPVALVLAPAADLEVLAQADPAAALVPVADLVDPVRVAPVALDSVPAAG